MKIKHLNKKYYALNGEVVHALKDINLDFSHPGLYAILGPSGCGKSTFLNCIGGFDDFDEGTIEILGVHIQDLSDQELAKLRANHIGYLFQNDHLIESMTVYENIIFSLQLIDLNVDDALIDQMMTTLEVSHLKHRFPKELSIGQRQRVALIRTVVKKPSYILADEPTGALDETNSHILMKFLKTYSNHSKIIMVTHDESLAKLYANRIIRLKDGSVVEDNLLSTLEKNNIEKLQNKNQKLSFSHILKMVRTNINIRLSRSIWTMILTMVTLLFFSISIVSSRYDEDEAYLHTIDKNQVVYFPIEKDVFLTDSIGDVFMYDLNFNDDDQKLLASKYQQEFMYKIDGYRYNLYTIKANENVFNSYYDEFIIEGYIPISRDLLNIYQLDVINGDVPHQNDEVTEIMISSYVSDILIKYGVSTISEDIHSYEDLIGQTFSIDQETFKITGIVDTKFDTELFEPLQSIEQDGPLTEKMGNLHTLLNTTLNNDIHLSFFVYEDFYQEEILDNQTYEMSLEEGKWINYDQSLIGMSEGRKNILLDTRDDIVYRNHLDDAYVVIPFDRLDLSIKKTLYDDIEERLITLVSTYANQNFDRLKDSMPDGFDVDDYIHYILINDENIYDPINHREVFDKKAEQEILSSYLEQEDMSITISYTDDIYQYQETFQIGGIYHEIIDYEFYVSDDLFKTLSKFKNPMIKHVYMLNTEDGLINTLFDMKKMPSDPSLIYTYEASDIYNDGIKHLSGTTEFFSKVFLYASILAFILTFLIYQLNMTNRISLSIKDVGIFSALGVSKKDISKIFITEALMMSMLSCVVSMIVSVIAIIGLNTIMTKDMYVDLHIYSFNGLSVIIVLLVALILPVISAVFPLRKLLQLKPVDIIKQSKK